jgi:hypothetical protein
MSERKYRATQASLILTFFIYGSFLVWSAKKECANLPASSCSAAAFISTFKGE